MVLSRRLGVDVKRNRVRKKFQIYLVSSTPEQVAVLPLIHPNTRQYGHA
jgi:hypothetical protein